MISCLSLSETLVVYRHEPIYAQLYTIAQKHSLLHLDVLTLLYHFARTAEGKILEIGPYMGGSSIAMAWGVRDAGRDLNICSIECGGAKTDHPTLPSEDITRDLKKNLAKRGVDQIVTVIEGVSNERHVMRKIERQYEPGSVGLFMLDADGIISRDLNLYQHLLREDCLMVIDDYYGPSVMSKVAPTRVGIDALIARGAVEAFGTYGWGTWIGRRVPGQSLGL